MKTAHAMAYLGVQEDGGLSPCLYAWNGVGSSYVSDKRHYQAPIVFRGSGDDAKERLKAILSTLPNVEPLQDDGHYLHYEHSNFLGLVTDVEFLIDEKSSLIHFRAAYRTGFWDMGANRRLIQKVKKFFEHLPA